MSESLSDKLKSLGVHSGTQHLAPSKIERQAYPIEEILAGVDLPTQFGEIFQASSNYPLDYIHGDIELSMAVDPHAIATWAKAANLSRDRLDKILFLDTETSGLAGGTGTYAFLVGLGFRSSTGFTVLQLFMRDPGQEQALLAALGAIIEPFEHIVTFNGKAFDIPLLNTRHVMNGITSPFKQMAHIDLLPLARRLWRNRLASRALKDLETEILHVPRTVEEVPGWMIPEIYFDYLRSGDARPLAGVFYHNATDILSLAALFNFSADLLFQPLASKEVPGLDLAAIARLFEETQQFELAVTVYEECLKRGDLPVQFYIDTVQRFADLHRKQARWEDAVALWKKAAEYQWIDAFIELAKYCEHQIKDYPGALSWTSAALEVVKEVEMASWRKKALCDELAHRKTRLEKRIDLISTKKIKEENNGS